MLKWTEQREGRALQGEDGRCGLDEVVAQPQRLAPVDDRAKDECQRDEQRDDEDAAERGAGGPAGDGVERVASHVFGGVEAGQAKVVTDPALP